MAKWIISSGCPFAERQEIIEEESLRQAYARAVEQTRCAGADITDPDVLSDTTWARPYSEDLAYSLGLYQQVPTEKDMWRSRAPWR